MRTKSYSVMLQIQGYIEAYYEENGVAPTQRSIAAHTGLSLTRVNAYLADMKVNGMLQKSESPQPKYLSSKKTDTHRYVPLIGTIACGGPIYAEENIEKYISFSNTMLGTGNYFLLRASGNSMIGAGIQDGDLVLIRQQNTATEGQIVVALIEDSATLKRYYTDGKKRKIRLHPENDELEDMYFDEISIQGVAVKVLKDLE